MSTRRNITLMLILTMLSINMIMVNIPTAHASPGPVMTAPTVNGITANLTPGQTFSINITIWNVTGMLGYAFRLSYDKTILTATAFASYDPFTEAWPSQINATGGYVDVSYSFPIPEYFGLDVPDTDLPFAIARIDFTVIALGFSPFTLVPSQAVVTNVMGGWWNPATDPPLSIVNGRFFNTEVHDVAVTNVHPNQTFVLQNTTVAIDVTVMNNGTFDETFSVRAYEGGNQIGSPLTATNVIPKTTRTLTFLWNTFGVAEGSYSLSATAAQVTGETYLDNNNLVDGDVTVVLVPIHDVAITSITPSPAQVVVGDNITISVTLENLGLVDETVNASVYYNTTLIETKTNIVLSPAVSKIVTYEWNTSAVSWGTYTISGNVTILPDETEIANNNLTDGTVGIGLNNINILALNVVPSPAVVGTTISLEAVIQNDGRENATYTVFFYYNTTLIANQTVTDQIPGVDGIVNPTVSWSTTDLTAGDYLLKAEVQPLSGEVDTANNVRTQPIELIAKQHDLAITSITIAPASVLRGGTVSINITVTNQGNVAETFDAKLFVDNTLIETQTGLTISIPGTTQVNFTWITPSDILPKVHTIKAEIPALTGETDTADNVKTGQVTVSIHDITVTSVTLSTTKVAVGESVTVTVTVKNQGNFTESFSVTSKYGTTNIGSANVNNLAAGQTRVVTFSWSTTGVSIGTYTISATASQVTDEDNITNNALNDGTVTIKQGSTISISTTPTTVTVGDKVTISGSITPAQSGAQVTIWWRPAGTTTWNNLTVTQTDANGQYTYDWTPTSSGNYELKASWPENATTMGDESDILSISVNESSNLMVYYIAAGIIAVIVIAVIVFYVLRVRKH